MIRSRSGAPLAPTLLCAGLLAGGCSKGPAPPRLVPVSGQVVYKGRPVGLASIEFLPEMPQGAQGFAAGGQTTQDGTFTLQTDPHGAGAVPGHYKVTVTTEARGAIPRRYADPGQTPLRIEIKEEGAADLFLRLTD
jgi:hypothetical protein